MPDASELSEAIVVWSGFGEASWPQRDDARVLQQFGEDRAAELLSRLKRLAAEFGESNAWATEADLVAVGKKAAAQFRLAHPELSGAAVDALAWCYTWDWK